MTPGPIINGKIWRDTLQGGLEPDCSSLDFAKATIAVAKKTMGHAAERRPGSGLLEDGA